MQQHSNRKCFSRPGWWMTLCGRDAANQGFGWSEKARNVGCARCRKRIKNREHYGRKRKDILIKGW